MKMRLHEALGVPQGIINSARRFYNDILPQLEKNIDPSDETGEYTMEIIPESPYEIGEFPAVNIELTLEIEPIQSLDSFDVIRMATKASSELDYQKPYRARFVPKVTNPKFTIVIASPENWTKKEFIDFYKNNRTDFITSIAHEFKHIYDVAKGKYEKLKDRSEYTSFGEISNFGIKPLDQFNHDSYYTTTIESLVRPTEMMSYLKENEISKKDFIDFLQTNTLYNNLTRLQNFSLQDMIEDIKTNYMPKVDEVLEILEDDLSESGIQWRELSAMEKIKLIFKIYYTTLKNLDGQSFKNMMTTNSLESFIGFLGEKKPVWERHINEITKYEKTPLKYFEKQAERMRKVATQLKRKIHKLYSLLPEKE